jgi:hypothetical protein
MRELGQRGYVDNLAEKFGTDNRGGLNRAKVTGLD